MSTSPQEKKRGRLSTEEENIILNNMEFMDDEAIAQIINRTPDVVAKFRAQAPVLQNKESATELIQQLRKKFFWAEVMQQLTTTEEISYFENYWASLIHQFASQGIVATDELMIKDLILTEIQVNRCLKAKRAMTREMDDLEDQIAKIYQEVQDPISRIAQIDPLKSRQNQIHANLKSIGSEWNLLQEKKDKKYDQLKATREKRLDKAEKAGATFFDLVKMLDSPEIREKEGRFNELYKQASEMAKLRFQQYFTYEDGSVDRPLLTPEVEESDDNA